MLIIFCQEKFDKFVINLKDSFIFLKNINNFEIISVCFDIPIHNFEITLYLI